MAAGIDIRHARSCQSRAGGRCTCKPTFQAHVFDSRTGKRIRKTVPDEERRPAVAAGRDVHRGAAVVDEHVATDAEVAAVVGVKGRDQPEAGVYLAAGELGEARAHRVGVVGRQCVQPVTRRQARRIPATTSADSAVPAWITVACSRGAMARSCPSPRTSLAPVPA